MESRWWFAKESQVWNADQLKEPVTLDAECYKCKLFPLPGMGWCRASTRVKAKATQCNRANTRATAAAAAATAAADAAAANLGTVQNVTRLEPEWHTAWRDLGKPPASFKLGPVSYAPLGYEDKQATARTSATAQTKKMAAATATAAARATAAAAQTRYCCLECFATCYPNGEANWNLIATSLAKLIKCGQLRIVGLDAKSSPATSARAAITSHPKTTVETHKRMERIVQFATQVLRAYQKKEVSDREWLPQVLKSILDMVALLHGIKRIEGALAPARLFSAGRTMSEYKDHNQCPWIMPLQKNRLFKIGDNIRHQSPSLLSTLVSLELGDDKMEWQPLWTFESGMPTFLLVTTVVDHTCPILQQMDKSTGRFAVQVETPRVSTSRESGGLGQTQDQQPTKTQSIPNGWVVYAMEILEGCRTRLASKKCKLFDMRILVTHETGDRHPDQSPNFDSVALDARRDKIQKTAKYLQTKVRNSHRVCSDPSPTSVWNSVLQGVPYGMYYFEGHTLQEVVDPTFMRMQSLGTEKSFGRFFFQYPFSSLTCQD